MQRITVSLKPVTITLLMAIALFVVGAGAMRLTAAPEQAAQVTSPLQAESPLQVASPLRLADAEAGESSPLQVIATQPSDGAVDVSTAGEVVVIFDRPVVPLTGIDAQQELPQPLTFDPPLAGDGQWLNTSVYTFAPDPGLAGSTTYSVQIDSLTASDGAQLAAPVIFSFRTTSPVVIEAQPGGEQIAPDATVSVAFSQPMEQAATEAAFSLSTFDDGSALAGGFSWDENDRAFEFTPNNWLDHGHEYVITVAESAQPASGAGGLRAPFEQHFTVAPLPAIEFTTPADGDEGAPVNLATTIRFNTQMSPTLVLENLSVSPVISTTEVYSYYSPYNREVNLIWTQEPQTEYAITVDAGAGDEYGNTLSEDYQFSFSTGDYGPSVYVDLEPFTHFSAFTTTVIASYYRNVDAVDLGLFSLPLPELYKLAGPNRYDVWNGYQIPDRDANRVWARSYESQVERNQSGVQLIELTDQAGDKLAPGVYLLEVDQPFVPSQQDPNAAGPEPDRYVIIISNHNLLIKVGGDGDGLVWMTDLAAGQPTPDQPIAFMNGSDVLGEGMTDADGLFTTLLTLPEDRWSPVLAVSGQPGDPAFAVVSSDWSQGIAPWDFGINSGYGPDDVQYFFYTDRPIYRPGQTIFWKGIIRTLENNSYRLPPGDMRIDITVRDDRGNTVHEETVSPNEHGTVNGRVDLADEATSGFYYLESRLHTGGTEPRVGGVSFQVASYRKPEFAISVTPEEPAYVQDDTVRIDVQADYFSGGALAGAPVTWRIIAEPYHFTWDDGPRDRYYNFTAYDPDDEDYDPYRAPYYGGLIHEGAGETDEDGGFTIEVPADLSDSPASQRWLIDVTVQSSGDQFVSNRVRVPVHKSEFYIGISPQSYVVPMDEESVVDLVALTAVNNGSINNGDTGSAHPPYPGAALDLTVYEFNWQSVYVKSVGGYQWETTVDRTPVYSTSVTTGRDGSASIAWTPPKAGQYQITATGMDERGNRSGSATFVYASSPQGDSYAAWPRDNNDRMELVADKELYAPGETASILIPSPFVGPVQALVTVERSGVLQAQLITLESNSETLEIPISADEIPNVYVSVTLVKGIDDSNPFAAMAVGTIELAVDASEKELTVDIAPSADVVRPGEAVSYTLEIVDLSGAPVTNAEVSVALVDKAIFTLAESGDARSLMEVFYAKRPLGVRTGALLVINEDRLSQQLADSPKGGGGGGGPGGIEVREEFADTAYWRADLTTDEQGRILFDVTLPDNLTTWVLIARAVSDETLVGDALNEVMATKELQIRPTTPRFFTAGDRSVIGAVVMNNSEEEIGDLRLEIGVTGADTGDSPTEFNTSLAPGEQARFNLPIQVDALTDAVTLTYTATATIPNPQSEIPNLTDAVRLTLPVNRYSTPEVVGSSGDVPPEGRTESILVPPEATDEGALLVTLEPSLAAGMVDGLDYLEHYPYECNEQTVSRFLPNLFTLRSLRTLGLDDPALADQLAFQLGIGVQTLVSRQNSDGGWGYWPGEESTPFVSAYALWGLATAGQMGYAVPERTLSAAVDYLEGQFVAPQDVEHNWVLNEMAFIHFVLAEMGEGDPGRASTLYDARERLAHYGKAYLAMALDAMNPEGTEDPRVETLLDDLFGAATLSATGASWHEGEVDWQTFSSDTRSTAIVLAAFTRLDPGQPLLSQVVRWLMSARTAGYWATTQENAWSIIALTDWLETSGELEADYGWTVTLNEDELGSGAVHAGNVDEKTELAAAITELLRDEANTLHFARSNDSGQLYYTTQLRYYLDALAVDARSRGIVVDRHFELADELISAANVGDVISVTVNIVAPVDLHHALIEVPIPAGTEPIDPGLETENAQYGEPELRPVDDGGPWRRWTPTYTDLRDDKLALFATKLPAGAYEYTFQVRAGLPGEYRVLPVYAEEMYFPEVWGRSAGDLFTVRK